MNDRNDLFLERALQEEHRVSDEALQTARDYATEEEVDLAEALIATKALTGWELALVKAGICEVPFVDLNDYVPCYSNTRLVPRTIADRHCVFPLFMMDGVLTVAMDDPLDLEATDQVRDVARCEVDAVICERALIRGLIARAYSLSDATSTSSSRRTEIEVDDDPGDARSSQPVVMAVNQLLADAVEQAASDVHINPDERDLHLRYRIDGVLQTRQGPSLAMHSGIVQRLKVMAHLDLTQTRRPQDGKFRFRHRGRVVDVRVSMVPTICGENVVMRLQTNSQQIHSFRELGMPGEMVEHVEHLITYPFGMFLVTGPTGSGKTTTLYTALHKLNDPSRNIMTIEDPVEIRLPFVRQIQTHAEIGMTFASALRSILRQDPDVVLVGEIRDEETAGIALQAALTGHLVLSTLHTNDAAGAVARLRDYGLPSFVINSAVLGVLAQRLVRRNCEHCVEPYVPDELVRYRFDLHDQSTGFKRGRGCGKCMQTGYRRRVGIYELLRFTPAIKAAVEAEASTERIRQVAMDEGLRLMWQDGLDKAVLGQTTLEEIAKATTIVARSSDAEHTEPDVSARISA